MYEYVTNNRELYHTLNSLLCYFITDGKDTMVSLSLSLCRGTSIYLSNFNSSSLFDLIISGVGGRERSIHALNLK